MKQENISLIVVDAVSPTIEECGDIALGNIQRLVDSEVTAKIYEFFVDGPSLRHNGVKIRRRYGDKVEISNILDEVIHGDIILTGGSLGNKHYDAFAALLEGSKGSRYIPVIHIPFDCTYSFEWKYDSGESWSDGKFGNPEMVAFDKYKEKIVSLFPEGYAIKRNGGLIKSSPEINESSAKAILEQWDRLEYMVERLSGNVVASNYLKSGQLSFVSKE